jgi:hypothetical protein
MEDEIHHRDTEHTELTQRLAASLCVLCVLCVSVVNAAFLFTQFKLKHYPTLKIVCSLGTFYG